jgi:transcriptional regulator with XRE-family HTH domain
MNRQDSVTAKGARPAGRKPYRRRETAASSADGAQPDDEAPAPRENTAPAEEARLADGPAVPDGPLTADAKARADARSLGQLVRSIRVSRGMSIESLAKLAGVSAGGISQIERGVGNPAFTTLVKMAYGMQVPVGSFLQSDQEETGLVVRKDHRKRLVPSEGLIYELLTPDLQRRLEVLRVQIALGFDNSERPFVHEGEECVHMLEGELLVYLGGDEYHLEEGDSITFDPTTPHWYRNPFSRPGIIFSAVTPPSF